MKPVLPARRRLLPASCLLLTLFLSACGPSYPRDRVAESLVELCRKEYGISVMARLEQTTLGVLVSIPGLMEELMKQAASSSSSEMPAPILVEGQYQNDGFHFQFLSRGRFIRAPQKEKPEESRPSPERDRSKPLKALDQVSTAMRRVALSTDAPLEFYTLIARDPGPANLDLIFSGHLDDLKRVQYLDISMGELQRRSRVAIRHQLEGLARETAASFLEDLGRRSLPQILSRYVAATKRFKELFPTILQMGVELQGRQQELLGSDWPVRQIRPDQALVYVPLSEIGLNGALLFTVQIQEGQAALYDIERLEGKGLPARYQDLGDPLAWKGFFYLEPLVLSEFLSEQIAKRVLSEFQPFIEKEEKPAKPKRGKAPKQPASDEEISKAVAETSAYVLNTYRFQNFKELTITDTLKGTRWVISDKDLPLYRRRNPPVLQPAS